MKPPSLARSSSSRPGLRPRGLPGAAPVSLLLAAGLMVSPALAAQETAALPGAERLPLPADSAVVELAPLEVRVGPPARRGKLAGFHRRRTRGAGEFITRREIERRDPGRLSDMVHLRPGVETVPYGDGSGRRHVRIGRAALLEDRGVCRISYWVDGVPFPGINRLEMDELSPGDVEGIEIYRGPSEIPSRFNRRGSQCGVVVVWTRDPTGE